MKIEKLNDNQIRCILNKEDLEQRELRLSELAYGSPKARALFRDMMEKAAVDCGFEVDNIPLMIEAIPVSLDCLILVVTKVEDPEVLDTRFSRFSSMANEEDMEDMEDMDEDEEDIPFEMEALSFHSDSPQGDSDSPDNRENGSVDVLETFNKAIAAAKQGYLNKQAKAEAPQPKSEQVFAFPTLDDVIRVAGFLAPFYQGDSSLYKDTLQEVYYLSLLRNGTDQKLFERACTICVDHSETVNNTYASSFFYKEHFKPILKSDALKILQEINGKG